MSQSKGYGPGANVDDLPGVNISGDVQADEPALFGRQAECAILDRLVAGARTGRGGALVVRGEPGAGKTTLLDDVARRATGFLVIRVAGIESEQDCASSTRQSTGRSAAALDSRLSTASPTMK
jgi:predicted ATP-dependent serine protease